MEEEEQEEERRDREGKKGERVRGEGKPLARGSKVQVITVGKCASYYHCLHSMSNHSTLFQAETIFSQNVESLQQCSV